MNFFSQLARRYTTRNTIFRIRRSNKSVIPSKIKNTTFTHFSNSSQALPAEIIFSRQNKSRWFHDPQWYLLIPAGLIVLCMYSMNKNILGRTLTEEEKFKLIVKAISKSLLESGGDAHVGGHNGTVLVKFEDLHLYLKTPENKKTFLRELIISNFLADKIPGYPRMHIVYEKCDKECSSIYSIASESVGTSNLEKLLKNEIDNNKQMPSKLFGLELALTLFYLTGNTDGKAANIAVNETTLQCTCIDHEKAKISKRSLNLYDISNIEGVNMIADFDPHDNQNPEKKEREEGVHFNIERPLCDNSYDWNIARNLMQTRINFEDPKVTQSILDKIEPIAQVSEADINKFLAGFTSIAEALGEDCVLKEMEGYLVQFCENCKHTIGRSYSQELPNTFPPKAAI